MVLSKQQAWFQGWPVTKGSGASGNWGHTGYPGVGGSSRGTGLGAIGAKPGSTAEERRKLSDAKRKRGTQPVGLGSKLEYKPDPLTVKHAEQGADRDIEHRARILGITKETIIDEVEKRLEEDLAQPLAIRRGLRGATGIAKDERFKTQFETGTSGGFFNPDGRKMVENRGLGTPELLSDWQRPVYGYFTTEGHNASHYGAIEFVLKDSVKERTTYTLGDSLHHFGTGQQTGGTAPRDRAAWDRHVDRYYGAKRPSAGVGYIEAQIQGGVSLKDVAKIVIHSESQDYSEIMDTFKAKGIKVEVDGKTR